MTSPTASGVYRLHCCAHIELPSPPRRAHYMYAWIWIFRKRSLGRRWNCPSSMPLHFLHLPHLSWVPSKTLPVSFATHAFLSVSYTHLRAHETKANLVCRL